MFSQLLTVSLSMSKRGYTSSIFGKVNGTFYHIVLLLQQLLPHICLILSDFFIFWQSMLDTILHVTLLNVHQDAKFFHCRPHCQFVIKKWLKLEMWANAQRDGRPAEHRWRPLFNAAKFD